MNDSSSFTSINDKMTGLRFLIFFVTLKVTLHVLWSQLPAANEIILISRRKQEPWKLINIFCHHQVAKIK